MAQDYSVGDKVSLLWEDALFDAAVIKVHSKKMQLGGCVYYVLKGSTFFCTISSLIFQNSFSW